MILGPTSHEVWMKLPMLLLLAYKAEGTSEENHRDKCTEVWVFLSVPPVNLPELLTCLFSPSSSYQ